MASGHTVVVDTHHTVEYHRELVANLAELVEFLNEYAATRGGTTTRLDEDERNFLELLVAKKLNYINNSVLGLERRLVPLFLLNNVNTNGGLSSSSLTLNECYARYDRLEADLGPTRLMRISLDVPNLLMLRSLGNFLCVYRKRTDI